MANMFSMHGVQAANLLADLSGKNYRFDGRNEGLINGQQYESETRGVFGSDGVLRCQFITTQCPSGFSPKLLSLSNASTKSSSFAISKNKAARNFFSLAGGNGIIRSARIYTFPDYPGTILTQVGTATLSEQGINYHTFINGFTDGIPLDVISIEPYTQYFSRQVDGALILTANTELMLSNGNSVRSRITGQFTFEGMHAYTHDFLVTYEPTFRQTGNIIDLEMPVSMRTL
ncbi:TPA: hypothetical protein MJA59_002958 [Klebsiella aerogenes]|nr:hypothetical protein [Klebsiella aerogenes]